LCGERYSGRTFDYDVDNRHPLNKRAEKEPKEGSNQSSNEAVCKILLNETTEMVESGTPSGQETIEMMQNREKDLDFQQNKRCVSTSSLQTVRFLTFSSQ
jgi:hypothetical protein